MKEAFSMPIQGWDPVRIVAQIVSLQALHYLVLTTLVPPLLAIFANQSALAFEGGVAQVGMVLDWREIAGKPTWDWPSGYTNWGAQGWQPGGVWLENGNVVPPELVTRPGLVGTQGGTLENWEWTQTKDPARGWVIAAAWLLTGVVDVILLVFLVRRPTHILDHALTLHLLHLIITSYYASGLPTSLFWWMLMAVHAGLVIVWAEQLAVKRELNRFLGFNLVGSGDGEAPEKYEMNKL